jgi:hypothetical protein
MSPFVTIAVSCHDEAAPPHAHDGASGTCDATATRTARHGTDGPDGETPRPYFEPIAPSL